MALGIPPGRPPPNSFLPPADPFAPSSWRRAHIAQEGIKGPVEDLQAPADSQHQDGTTGLCRPGKARPPPGLAHEVRGGPSLRSDGLSSSPQEPLTLQPDAMLLWLTLALLWSPTCWAQRKSGWGSPQPTPLEAPSLPALPSGLGPGPALVTDGLYSQACPLVGGTVSFSGQKQPTCHCVFIFFSSPLGSFI